MQRDSCYGMNAVRPVFNLILGGLIVCVFAGCAESVRWENRQIDPSLWAADRSYCRRDSERRAGVEQDRELGRAETIGGQSTGSRYRQDMIQYDSSRYALQLYEACLHARGYRKVMNNRSRRAAN